MAKKPQNTEVLAKPFEFMEGGTRLHVYPAGTRLGDLSDSAIAWLDVPGNVKYMRSAKMIVRRKMTDEESAALTAEIDTAEKELAEAQQAVLEAATAIVEAQSKATLLEATGVNSTAAVRLNAIQKRYDLLTLGPDVLLTQQELRAQRPLAEAELAEAATAHETAVDAMQAAKSEAKAAAEKAEAAVAQAAEEGAPDTASAEAELAETAYGEADNAALAALEALNAAEERLGLAQQQLAALNDA